MVPHGGPPLNTETWVIILQEAHINNPPAVPKLQVQDHYPECPVWASLMHKKMLSVLRMFGEPVGNMHVLNVRECGGTKGCHQ